MESLEDQIKRAQAEAQGRAPQPWDDAEWWDQAPGTAPIAGRVVEVGSGNFTHGAGAVIVLEQADGSYVKFAALRTALRGKVEDAGVTVGDVVSVDYLGMREPQSGGNPYHAYSFGHVRNDGPAESSDSEREVI